MAHGDTDQTKSLAELVDERAKAWIEEHGFDDMDIESEPEDFDPERAEAGDYIIDPSDGARYRLVGVIPVVAEIADPEEDDPTEEY